MNLYTHPCTHAYILYENTCIIKNAAYAFIYRVHNITTLTAKVLQVY